MNRTILLTVYNTVFTLFYSSQVPLQLGHSEKFLRTYWKWIDSEGRINAVKRVKLARLALTRFLAADPLKEPAGISLTRDGLPTILCGELRDQIRQGNPRAISWGLTLLSISRMELGGTPVNTDPITKIWSGVMSKTLQSDIKTVIDRLNWRLTIPDWSGFHHTSKSGPNGPALWTALVDLEGITPERLKAIHTLAPTVADIITNIRVRQLMGTWPPIQDKILPRTFVCDSRLSIKEDKETKSRVFAILDYWSQTALRPLHKACYQALSKIDSDCTFAQSEGLALAVPDGHHYHSVDLQSATDRFPCEATEYILSLLTESKEVAVAWRELMVNREFHLKGDKLRYGAGQPMGAYSSWASFTLSHHTIIQVSAYRAGLTLPFSGYRMLGDDIVIAHDEVSRHYREILSELDVPISEAKTHVSKDTFEFAKRWVHKGNEVTPFPVHALIEVHKHDHLLMELIRDVRTKGFSIAPTTGEPRSVAILLGSFGIKGRLLDQRIRNYRALLNLPLPDAGEHEVGAYVRNIYSASMRTYIPCRSDETTALLWKAVATKVCQDQLERVASELDSRTKTLTDEIRAEVESQDHLGSADQAELMNSISAFTPIISVSTALAGEAWASVGLAHSMASFGIVYEWLTRARVIAAPYGSLRFVRRHHLLAASKPMFLRDMRKELSSLLDL